MNHFAETSTAAKYVTRYALIALRLSVIAVVILTALILWNRWPVWTAAHFAELIEHKRYDAIGRIFRGHDDLKPDDWQDNFRFLDANTLSVRDRTVLDRLIGRLTFTMNSGKRSSFREFRVERGHISSIAIISVNWRKKASQKTEDEQHAMDDETAGTNN